MAGKLLLFFLGGGGGCKNDLFIRVQLFVCFLFYLFSNSWGGGGGGGGGLKKKGKTCMLQ